MEAFEYRLLSVEQGPHGFVAQLNQMGGSGWEAVGQVDCRDEDGDGLDGDRLRYLLLKRPCTRSAGPAGTRC